MQPDFPLLPVDMRPAQCHNFAFAPARQQRSSSAASACSRRALGVGGCAGVSREQAGGLATDGYGRVMEIKPEALHERTPLYIGSKVMVEAATEFLEGRRKYDD